MTILLEGSNWPTIDQYHTLKPQLIDEYSEFYKVIIGSENERFGDLTPEKKDIAVRILAHFHLGAWVVYRKFGFKYQNFYWIFSTRENTKHLTGAAFSVYENCFIYNLDNFKEVLEMVSSGNHLSRHSIQDFMSPEDFFELTGVEEASHALYYQEKGVDAPNATLQTGSELDYHTSDPEERGLIWRVAYAKRYLPDRYKPLSNALKEVRKLRLDSRGLNT